MNKEEVLREIEELEDELAELDEIIDDYYGQINDIKRKIVNFEYLYEHLNEKILELEESVGVK